MGSFAITIYLVSAGSLVVLWLLLALLTWEHCRYARSCMRGLDRHRPTGRVALFAPCKGVDLDLMANLASLLEQDYDNYEVIFIVESRNDPACPTIRRAIAEHPRTPARIVVAGRATDSGQKVHNLRIATKHLSPRIKYLAFVDSDARPRPEWLRTLASRLDQPGIGAVTGYRWFTPDKPTIANGLVYSMNCDMVTLLTRSSHHLIWGGSWAIRRDVFEAIGLRNAWKGTLSDDLMATRLMREARLQVRFEPVGIVASPLHESPERALSFIRRQYLVTRLYTFHWWLFSLVASFFLNLVWFGNLGALICGLLTGSPAPWIPAAVLASLYLVTIYRGILRQSLVKIYFPEWAKTSRRIQRFDIFANPLVELAHGIGVACAAVGRWVTWRNIRYHVLRGGRVQQIVRGGDRAETPEMENEAAEADAVHCCVTG